MIDVIHAALKTLAFAFRRDGRGSVMMTFSLAFPVLLGASALAIDSASFHHQQSRMQNVADAAALAVAKELHIYRKNLGELEAVGKARVESLLAEAGLSARPHVTTIAIDEPKNLVDVGISLIAKSFVPAGIWGENPITAASQALAYGQSRLCILGLDKAKADTIKVDGAASLNAPDCSVQSNSTDSNGLNVAPDSEIVSTVICSSGGAKGDSDSFVPPPQTDCPQLSDPLASRAAPLALGCDYLDRKVSGGKVSISPGSYCGGLKIDKDAEVTAEPGIYTFTLGKLEVKDTAKLMGEYVAFNFQDDLAVFTFDPKTTINLSAPKDGPMAGILFFESPLAPLGRDFTIKSENAQKLLGTIYLPQGKLKIDAKANVAELSAYTVLVTKQLEVKGANLIINSDYGGTDVPVPDGVGPNSSMVALKR